MSPAAQHTGEGLYLFVLRGRNTGYRATRKALASRSSEPTHKMLYLSTVVLALPMSLHNASSACDYSKTSWTQPASWCTEGYPGLVVSRTLTRARCLAAPTSVAEAQSSGSAHYGNSTLCVLCICMQSNTPEPHADQRGSAPRQDSVKTRYRSPLRS